MKKVGKNAKFITTLTLIVLAFFCSFNITHAYFTATAHESGTLTFADLDVRFVCTDVSSDHVTGDYTQDNLYTITLYPVGGTVTLDEPFELSATETGSAISSIYIWNMDFSSSAYVRFWIDAYPVIDTAGNVDTTVNYGRFFFLKEDENFDQFLARGNSSSSDIQGSSCYFVKPHIDPYQSTGGSGLGGLVDIGNSLTFKDVSSTDKIPEEALGAQLKISITLEAVQVANQAFTEVFDDEKGYYNDADLWVRS